MKSVNNIPAGKAKQKESLIQIFYETSATHFSSQLAIKVSFAVSLRLHTPFIEVFPAKLWNETSFKMDSFVIWS